jgi:hypothetical protein
MIEDEPGRSRVLDFKKKVGSGTVRDTFTTCEELAYKVAASLGRYLSTLKPDRRAGPDLTDGNVEFFENFFRKSCIYALNFKV